jgi:hypothetical protein
MQNSMSRFIPHSADALGDEESKEALLIEPTQYECELEFEKQSSQSQKVET